VTEIAVPVPPEPQPELSPGELFRAELLEFQERMLLARRLTLETSEVRTRQHCTDGVSDFMLRARLEPVTGMPHARRHPTQETPDEAAAACDRIRYWCVTQALGPDTVMEDYTDAGLAKRLTTLQSAHANWKRSFLAQLNEEHRRGYISLDRLHQVLPQLRLTEPQDYMRVVFQVVFDYIIPRPGNGTPEDTVAYQAKQRERLLAALRRLPGDGSTYDGTLYADREAHVRVEVFPHPAVPARDPEADPD